MDGCSKARKTAETGFNVWEENVFETDLSENDFFQNNEKAKNQGILQITQI